MDEHEILGRLTRVQAPAGFEEAVLGRLPAARRGERRRARRTRFVYGFAGSAALILAAVLVFRPAAPPEPDTVLTFAERQALAAGAGAPSVDRRAVPVYETMDYASELQNARPQPATVYILEQVSEIPASEISY